MASPINQTLGLLDPQVQRDLEVRSGFDRLQAAQGQFLRQAKDVRVLQEGLNDEELAQEALRRSPQDKIAARALFERAKKRRDEGIAARQTSLAQAVDAGGGRSYASVFGLPEQQEAIRAGKSWKRNEEQAVLDLAREAPVERKAAVLTGTFTPEEEARLQQLQQEDLYGAEADPRGVFGKAAWGLGIGGRAGAGFGAGAMEQLRKEIPQSTEPATPESALQRGLKQGGKALGTYLKYATPAAIAAPVNEALGIDPLGRVGEVLGGGAAALASGDPTIGGMPAGEVARKLLWPESPEEDLLPTRMVLAGAKRAGSAAIGESGDAASATEEFRQQRRLQAQAALDQVLQEAKLPSGAPVPESVVARAKDILQGRLSRDVLGTFQENPELGQTAGELVLDPLNVAGGPVAKGIGRGVGAAAKGIGAGARVAGSAAMRGLEKVSPAAAEGLGRWGEDVSRGVKRAKEALTYLPHSKELDKVSGDAGALTRMSAEEAGRHADVRANELELQVGVLDTAAKDKGERAILQKLLNGEIGITHPSITDDMRPRFEAAWVANENLGRLHFKWMEDTGLAQKFEDAASNDRYLLKTELPKLSPVAKKDWARAMRGSLELEDVHPSVRPLVEAGRRMVAAKGAPKELQATRKIGPTNPQTGLPQSYVPRNEDWVTKEDGTVYFRPHIGQLSARAARHRQADVDSFELDPVARWKRAIAQTKMLAEKSDELRRSMGYLKGAGAVTEVDVVPGAVDDAAKAESALLRSIKATGKAGSRADELAERATTAFETGAQVAAKRQLIKPTANKTEAVQLFRLGQQAVRTARKEKKLVSRLETEKAVEQIGLDVRGDLVQDLEVKTRNAEDYRAAQAKLSQKKAELEAATGVEYEVIGPQLQAAISKATGKPGKTRMGDKLTLAPKPFVRRLQELTIVKSGALDSTEKARGVLDAYQQTMRTFIHPLRIGATLLGGLAYHGNNFVSAVGLGGLAHGVKALSPKLQRNAVAGALLSSGLGSRTWGNIPVALRSGEKATLGRLTDIARDIGIIDQHMVRMAADITPTNALSQALETAASKASPVFLPLGEKLSSRNVARLVDNYQKLVSFLGFIEGTSPAAIARALDKTSEFAGNYRRISEFEKIALKDHFLFYNWNRFILPHLAKQLAKNPQRFLPWLKMHDYFRRRGEQEAGFTSEVIPDWKRGGAVVAPKAWQVPANDKAAHRFAVQWMDDPWSMAAGYMSQLTERPGQFAAGQLSNTAAMTIALLYGRDPETWEELSTPAPWSAEDLSGSLGLQRVWGKTRANTLVKMLLAPVERPTEALHNMYNLYWTQRGISPDAMDLAMRYKAARDFGILSEVLDAVSGKDVAQGSVIPGINTTMVKGLPTAAKAAETTNERMRGTAYQMAR